MESAVLILYNQLPSLLVSAGLFLLHGARPLVFGIHKLAVRFALPLKDMLALC